MDLKSYRWNLSVPPVLWMDLNCSEQKRFRFFQYMSSIQRFAALAIVSTQNAFTTPARKSGTRLSTSATIAAHGVKGVTSCLVEIRSSGTGTEEGRELLEEGAIHQCWYKRPNGVRASAWFWTDPKRYDAPLFIGQLARVKTSVNGVHKEDYVCSYNPSPSGTSSAS